MSLFKGTILHPFVLLMFMLCLASLAQISLAEPVFLTDKETSIDVTEHLQVLQDPSRKLSIGQVTSSEYKQQFKSLSLTSPDFGFTLSAYWLRLELSNLTESIEQWYLISHHSSSTKLRLYTVSTVDNTFETLKAVPENKIRAYALLLPKQTAKTVYLRIENQNDVLSLDLELASPQRFVNVLNTNTLMFGLIVGSLSALAIYNFMLFLTLWETSFLALSLFISAIAIELLRLKGLFHDTFFLGSNFSAIFSYIILASMTSFYYQVLSIRQYFPTLEKGFRYFFWFSVLVGIMSPWLALKALITGIMGMILLSLALPTLWILYRRNNRMAKSMVTAVMVFLIPIIFIIMGVLGIIEIQFALTLFYLGLFAFLIFLSWMLAERTRELREQKERSEAVSKSKDEFLTTMSHELRTPMHAVIGVGQLLKNTSLTQKQQDYLDKFDIASHHMLRLINDVLDLARLNSNRQTKLENKPFHLEVLLEEMEKLFSIAAQQKVLHLSIKGESEPYPVLSGDMKRLEQVLVNLLGNAIKYTEAGTVSLRVKVVVAEDQKTASIRFEVSDTGIGIALEKQAGLFQPFYQANNCQTHFEEGSGLGLAISQRLVRNMGGQLEFYSIPGEGSCFFFQLNLPIVDKEAANLAFPQQKKVSVAPFSLQDVRILLVDDDELNRLIASELLSSVQGAEVSLAESGQEATQLVQQHAFDLVFMDVSMPDMDGYETTQRIRSDSRFRDLPIVALTAHAIVGERERCLAAGMNDYLTKPFGVDELANKVLENLKRSPYSLTR